MNTPPINNGGKILVKPQREGDKWQDASPCLAPLLRALCVVILLTALAPAAFGDAIQCGPPKGTSWKGGAGSWPDNNWSNGKPTKDTDVCIAQVNGQPASVELGGSKTPGQANNLQVGKDVSLTVQASAKEDATLEVYGSTIDDAGTISLKATDDHHAYLTLLNRTVSLEGSGTLSLSGPPKSLSPVIDTTQVNQFTISKGFKIQGEGSIGYDSHWNATKVTNMINRARIEANVTSAVLDIRMKDISNEGNMEATEGGELYVRVASGFTNKYHIAAKKDSAITIDDQGTFTNSGKTSTIWANAAGAKLFLTLHDGGTNEGWIAAGSGGKLRLSTYTNFVNKGEMSSGGDGQLTVALSSVNFINDGTVKALTGSTTEFTGNGDIKNQRGIVINNGTIEVRDNGTKIKGKGIITGNAVIEKDGGKLIASTYQQTGGYNQDDSLLQADRATVSGGILFGTGTVTVGTPQAPASLVNGGILFAGDGTPNGGGVPDKATPGTFAINGSYQQTRSGVLYELMKNSSLFSRTVVSGGTAVWLEF